jgi:O-antigen/teichoic acid export membrane protein
MGIIQIAVYQSSVALLFLIHRFAIIPFSNLLPEFIRYYETGDICILKKKGLYCHSIVMLATFISLAIAALMNKLFVTLWIGEEFFAGYHFTVVYSFFTLLYVARHNGYIMYQATGYLKPILICHLIQIPINICLTLILLGKFGLIGIAYAYLLSSLPVIIISQLVLIRIPEKRFRNVIKLHA